MSIGYKIVLLTIFASQIQSCLSGDRYCARCGGSQCLTCWGSYITPQGTCQTYSSKLEQCLFYATSNSCLVCNFGYKLSSGKCVAISQTNCLKTNPNGDCIACDNGNKVQDDLTCPEQADSDEECDTDKCQVCEVMAGWQRCLKCEAGYVIHSYDNSDGDYEEKCIVQSGNTLNCNRTDHNSQVDCLECELNYYMHYGKCTKNENLDYAYNLSEKSSTMIHKILTAILVVLV